MRRSRRRRRRKRPRATAEAGDRGRARRRNRRARPPVQEARAHAARIDTEARTLAKILNAGGGGLFPAVLEQIAVDRGYETALGAALGEDLDAPLDQARLPIGATAHRRRDDPALPDGRREPGRMSCARRAQLARRLAQIGIVDDGRRPAPAGAAEARPAAGQPQGCAVALGRLRRRAPMRRPPPRSGWRRRTGWPNSTTPGRQAEAAVKAAEALLASAESCRARTTATRAAPRARPGATAQRAVDEAREALSRAEKAAGELAGRAPRWTSTRSAHRRRSCRGRSRRWPTAKARRAEAPDLTGLQRSARPGGAGGRRARPHRACRCARRA